MNCKMKFVQFGSMRDLIMFAASSPVSKVIQYLKFMNSHVYFLLAGNMTDMFLYLVKLKDAVDGNFITYNSYTGEIGSSDKLVTEPSIESFPIVEIVNQNLLPTDTLDKVSQL